MSTLRRVLPVLCLTVLLRDGSCNSPLDFFRDIKNKVFGSSNSVETSSEQPVQCAGLDQDGVCTLLNSTANGSLDTEGFGNIDTSDGVQTSDPNMLTNKQLATNETVAEDTNNTNYTEDYDRQQWNDTAANNTDSYRNDFDYNESEQNGTNYNEAKGEETNNQEKGTRAKRETEQVEISTTLKTPDAKSKPLVFNITVFTVKSASTTEISRTNLMEDKEAFTNTNNTSTCQNESIITNIKASKEKEIDFTTGITVNETVGNATFDHGSYQLPNNTSHSSEDQEALSFNDTVSDFSKVQNTTEQIDGSQITVGNCMDCIPGNEGSGMKNTSINELNGTESMDFDQGYLNENTTHLINSSVPTLQNNITKLQGILQNSTRIIEKIVENIVPVISDVLNETTITKNNQTKLGNIGLPKTIKAEDQINQTNTTELRNTKQESGDKTYNEQLNIMDSQTNATSEKDLNTGINPLNETSNISINLIEPHLPKTDSNDSTKVDNNITDNATIKREKRSINFTIISESNEEPEDSASTFPDTTENLETDSSLSATTNSTVQNSQNGTQEVEIVGPVCMKQYEQCTNSSDCCDDYECVTPDENNSTLYCDIRPENLTLSTYLPLTINNPA